jgi:hypothetical protein
MVATIKDGDEFPMNSWPTSENAQKAKFAEFLFSDVGLIRARREKAED